MADTRREYEVDINGMKHVMLLDPQDAASLYGDNAKAKAVKAPANKAAEAPANK